MGKADSMEGLATVYSDKLNGRKTANGQIFSQQALTAAHPSLAFGTRVKVTNTKNLKSVEVRINDRDRRRQGASSTCRAPQRERSASRRPGWRPSSSRSSANLRRRKPPNNQLQKTLAAAP
ncbi:MAG: septal ring lytic transglycosylase RlpA family protein [Casimicrobiaceae bacterium]